MAVKRYDGSAWQTVAGVGPQGAAATSSSIATWVKTASGGETSVSGNDDNSQPLSYTVGQELVFINGALQKRGVDYTATTGNSITGLTALVANDVVTVWTVNAFSVTGAIANTIVDNKGDILVGTGADTPGILSVGSNDQVLTADSSTATGLKWGAAPSGEPSTWTLINTGGTSLTGAATITISGISGYKQIYVVFHNYVSTATTGSSIGVRINGDTGNNYLNNGLYVDVATTYSTGNWVPYSNVSGQSSILVWRLATNTADGTGMGSCFIDSADQSGWKRYQSMGAGSSDSSANGFDAVWNQGLYKGNAPITSISAFSSSGNFDAGSLYVYGAN